MIRKSGQNNFHETNATAPLLAVNCSDPFIFE